MSALIRALNNKGNFEGETGLVIGSIQIRDGFLGFGELSQISAIEAFN